MENFECASLEQKCKKDLMYRNVALEVEWIYNVR